VVKSAENRPGNDDTEALDRAMDRSVLVQRAMSPRVIITARAVLQDPTLVPFAQGDDMSSLPTMFKASFRSTVMVLQSD
jgi:hypothetical protein